MKPTQADAKQEAADAWLDKVSERIVNRTITWREAFKAGASWAATHLAAEFGKAKERAPQDDEDFGYNHGLDEAARIARETE